MSLNLSRNEKLAVLAKQHEVYALNEYVYVNKKVQRFEAPAYHNGMVDFYRNLIQLNIS
jgi:hypothetical protein